MILYFAVAYFAPVIIWIVWKRKSSARTFPLIVGMISYMFISLARGMVRVVILNDGLKQTPWLFYLVSAFLTGVFEEVGRYIVFRYAISNYDRWSDCVSYGIGHGAIEIMLTHNIMENTIYDSMVEWYYFIMLILLSVSMSVLVFASAHHTDNKKFIAAAVGLHAIIDFILAGYRLGVLTIEGAMFIDNLYTIGVCYLAYRVYHYYREY